MVFPTKKDIEEAIESLDINVEACSEWGAPINAKRVGSIITMAEMSGHISKDEGNDYNNKSNQIIRKFNEKCHCKFKQEH